MIETYIHPFPISKLPSEEATLAGFEMLPIDIVADIQINDAALDLLPKEFKYLGSSDYFTKNIRMSVPDGESADHVLTPNNFGRTIPLACGVIPFGSSETGWHLGRILTGKGSFVAGNSIRRMLDQGITPIGDVHLGLLSVQGARDDMVIANAMLTNGFRSALHLGYAILDDTRLKTWLGSRWIEDNHRDILDNSFTRVKENGGSAYLIRLGGSLERMDYGDIPTRAKSRRLYTEIKQSSRLMALECSYPKSHLRRITSALRKPDVALTALRKISEGIYLTPSECNGYIDFLSVLIGKNASALHAAEKSLGYRLSGKHISEAKDLDLTLFSYDYDSSKESGAMRFVSDEENIQGYLYETTSVIDTFVSELITPNFLYPAGYGYGAITEICKDIPGRITKFYNVFSP